MFRRVATFLVPSCALTCGHLACSSEGAPADDGSGSGYTEPSVEPEAPPELDVDVRLGPRGLRIDPGHSDRIEIEVLPPGVYEVRLAVDSSTAGAFLDRDRVRTKEDGTATARLTVPFEASELTVIAFVGGQVATLDVAVGRALATVLVEPVYEGEREVDEWIVGVLSGGTPCPDANRYQAEGLVFRAGEPIVFPNVPAAAPVQVFARGKSYIFGCTANELRPGVTNTITLPVVDRALQLAELHLELLLWFDRTPELEGALATLAANMVEKFRSELATDTEALLAAMSEIYALRAPAFGQSRFQSAASERRWGPAVERHLAERSAEPNAVSAAVQRWLATGYGEMFRTQGFLRGTLSTSSDPSSAGLELTALGSVSPSEAEVTTASSVSLGATADDNVSLGFDLALRPSRLLAELAQASAGVSSLQDVAPALQPVIDCGALGAELLALSEDQEEPLPECGPTCLGQLCAEGLSFMWVQAEQAALSVKTLNVGALGAADIDEVARPLRISGTWAGQSNFLADTEIQVRGGFAATPEE